MKIGLIINTSAGTATDNPDAKKLDEIFKSFNIETEIAEVTGDKLHEAADKLVAKGIDALVAAGGDGTISTVASRIIENKLPLGILPLGTLNHFAKDLNIPLSIEEAAAVIAKNNLISIDTGEINGRIFINNSSIGFYPLVIKHREREKKKTGKWLAMLKAIIKVFILFPLMKIRIISDQNKIHCRTPFVFIGNNEYEMDLFNIGTRTAITGGTLSLYYPVVTNRISMIIFFFHALFNKLNRQKDFKIEMITGLTIETNKRRPAVSVDGEVIHLEQPLNYRIRPKDLTVIVP